MQNGQSLHDLLVQAKPGWSQQDLQAAERKLSKVGVATCPELAAALDGINARLQEAGLQRFSAETVGALGRALASSPSALAPAAGPPAPRPGPSASATAQAGLGGSSFRAQLQAGQGRGKFGKGGAGFLGASSLDKAVGSLPGMGGLPGLRLQKAGKGGFMQQAGPRLGAVAGVGAETIEAQPPVGRWEGWALVDLPKGTSVEPRPLSKEAAAKAQAQAEESEEEDEDEDEDEDEERLSEAELLKLCKAKAIPLERLESSKKAVQVLRLFERLEKSPASTLKNEYKTRGFAPDVGMRKEALLARVKEVVIWENLQVEHLRSVCEAQGLPADKSLQHGQLLQLLSDASWVARGVPLQRLPNLVVAHGVLDSVDGLATRSPADLAAQAKRLGVPLEAKPDREDLLPRLRAAMVWKQMESPELRVECEARGAPLGDVPEASARPAQPASFMLDSSKGSVQEKQALERLLLQSLWLDVWAAAGISARRLGGHAAAGELFQAVEKLRAEGMAALQESYQALGLPLRSCSDRRFILQRLSESLFWKALPLDQLREECRERGVEAQGLGDEEGGEEAERRSCTQALLSDACSRAWAERGIPVKRLETPEAAAAVAEEWGRLQGITDQDLRIQCEMHGLPKEAGLEKEDLVGLLKEVAVWEALPLRELRLETAKLESAGGAEQPSTAASGGDEWAEQCRHVERLLLDRCAGAYDAKGIPARQLGSLKAAAKLAGQWAALEAMGTDGLREECLRLGMPSQNLQRQELLLLARDVALWRQLPLADLKLTCRAKGVAPPDGVTGAREEDQRELLVDALLVERCEAFYERRGIPVRRLGSVQAAARLAERWGRLESMSAGDLLLKASAFGVHAEAGLERSDLMDRLKSAMLWHELPFREIQKECRYYGVNSIAHPHERRELAQRLAAFLWAPAPPPPPQPKPQPQPQPRQPPQGGPQPQQRKSAAPPPRRPPPSQQTAATKHLKTLGLPPTATAQEIKKAYRRLALRYHPDKNLEASQEEASRRFREVADAYAALAERVKRG